MPRFSPVLRLGSTLVLASLISACGSDDTNNPASSTPAATLTGTVAVGAPVSGASINAKCAIGSFSATSNANGNYGLVIPSANFPCALRSSGGTAAGRSVLTLHSFARNTGTANVTPLTDLALALQVNTSAGKTLADWFANPDNLAAISSALTDAADDLRAALIAAGYTVPATWTAGSTTPFSSTFTPNPASDAYDQLLEAIADALENSTSYADYNALLTAFVAGSALPDAPEEEPQAPANLAILTAYAGTYTVTGGGSGDPGYCATCGSGNRNHLSGIVTISANGDINFDTGISFTSTQIKSITDYRTTDTDKHIAINFGSSDTDERIRLYFKTSGTAAADIVEIIHDNGSGRTTRALIGNEEEETAICSGKTKTVFAAVSGTYRLMAKYAYSNTPDSGRYTNRNYYDLTVDSSNCSIAVSTDDGIKTYNVEDTPPQITSNSGGTDIRLEKAPGDALFFSYANGDKKIFVGHLYQDSTYYWGLYGVDSARCPIIANTTATPPAMDNGPYVIAYAGNKNLGIDQRSNVTASFSENGGLQGYRASANENWNRGCTTNNNAVGDAVIRIGKWHTGNTSPGYYEKFEGFKFTAYEGFHYAIAQAVSNKPTTGSKLYTLPSGWKSEFTTSSITMGGSISCNGSDGSCVSVNFATGKASVNLTVSDNTGGSLTFNSSNLDISTEGLIDVSINGALPTGALRLMLGGNGASHMAASFTVNKPAGAASIPIFGSFGLKEQPQP